jgi:hypothetical protein
MLFQNATELLHANNIVVDFYCKMQSFWATRLPFALDLARHLIVDVIALKDSMKDSNISNKDRQEAQRSVKTYLT